MSHGPVMLDLQGTQLQPEERDMLRHPAAGGVILFSRNYSSPDQIHRLVTEIHELRSPPLLVAVDQEGGRVQRFRDGFTRLPPAAWLGTRYRRSREEGLAATRDLGWLMAAELLSVGVDFSFAPVLDLNLGLSSVIGDRAFGDDPRLVAELAQAWCHGVHDAGMASVGKHFPGHGGVREDSHLALPRDRRTLDDLWLSDLIPFRRLVETGLEGVMPAHVIYADVDARPAGFSAVWLQTVLRERLGFQGVVFSDDLNMAAAGEAGDFAHRAADALAAGCDMVLVCNNRPGAIQALESLVEHRDPVAQARLVRMHGHGRWQLARLRGEPRWKRALALASEAEQGASLDLNF